MSQINKEGFQTVETDLEELDEKIRKHRRKIFMRTVQVIALCVVLFVGYKLWNGLRSYDSYEILEAKTRTDSDAVRFEEFQGKILKYSNDGASYMNTNDESVWNQSFEMGTPKLDICEKYLAIYDQGGSSIYIMTVAGLKKKIETTMPIQTVKIASQGTIAVLLKEDTCSYVKLYDKNGKELASGEFYGNQGGFPVDIALSSDAQKMAVDLIDVSDGKMKSTITFYNFGSVGQNEIDNNVGTFSYNDMLIPNIDYVSNNRMFAFGDHDIIIFEGSQKPAVKEEIKLEQEIDSLFYNNKYVGVAYTNEGEEVSHHIQVYDSKGSVVMENDTSLAYTSIGFLDNNEICITNDYECELYTIHSIRKFSYKFEKKIHKIITGQSSRNYTFIMDGETQEVKLK